MTLVIYQFSGRPWGTPNFSPFCMKLETFVRMTAIPHEVRPANMQKAPKGKVPYAKIDGQLVGDSQSIIDVISKMHGAEALDAHLTAEQHAIGHTVRRMLEEATYFSAVYTRWIHDEGYRILLPEFSKLLPKRLAPVLMSFIRRKIRKTLHLQGTGRHTFSEASAMGMRDIDALSVLMSDHAYLLGGHPSSYDATAFAFVEGILGFPHDSPMRVHAHSKANLISYRERMRARYFPELESEQGEFLRSSRAA